MVEDDGKMRNVFTGEKNCVMLEFISLHAVSFFQLTHALPAASIVHFHTHTQVYYNLLVKRKKLHLIFMNKHKRHFTIDEISQTNKNDE